MTAALRDAALSALIALGLFAPMVGLVLDNGGDGVTLRGRPIAAAVVVAMVFVGRLIICLKPPAAPVAPAAESEVVCRMVKVTGTRLRKERVCTSNVTREQSAEWLRNQQDHGNNIGSNAAVNGGG